MKLVLISDTHNYHKFIKDLPDGDVLIHSGDFSSLGHFHEVENFIKWFVSQPHKYKIFIAGNHDRSFDSKWQSIYYPKDNLDTILDDYKVNVISNFIPSYHEGSNVYYLDNTEIVIEGVKFYGTPITPSFYAAYWAFNVDRGNRIQKFWDNIPTDVNVLITHGPPYGILDCTPDRVNAGCENLLSTITTKLKSLKLHVFGHIHMNDINTEPYVLNGVTYINASICNNDYDPINLPKIFVL